MKRILVCFLIMISLYGCAGTGLHKRVELMPDEFKIKPEWNENKEGDFKMNRVGAEVTWKLK